MFARLAEPLTYENNLSDLCLYRKHELVFVQSADYPCWQNSNYRAGSLIAKMIVYTTCAVAFAEYRMRTVCNVSDITKSIQLNQNSLAVIHIVRFLNQSDLASRCHEFASVFLKIIAVITVEYIFKFRVAVIPVTPAVLSSVLFGIRVLK